MKEMLASLPQYQEQREKVLLSITAFPSNLTCLQFSLHLNMAQECMSIFERDKLSLAANVEQVSCSSQCSLLSDRLLELCNWSDRRGQNAETSC